MNNPKVFKLGAGNDLGIPRSSGFGVERSNDVI